MNSSSSSFSRSSHSSPSLSFLSIVRHSNCYTPPDLHLLHSPSSLAVVHTRINAVSSTSPNPSVHTPLSPSLLAWHPRHLPRSSTPHCQWHRSARVRLATSRYLPSIHCISAVEFVRDHRLHPGSELPLQILADFKSKESSVPQQQRSLCRHFPPRIWGGLACQLPRSHGLLARAAFQFLTLVFRTSLSYRRIPTPPTPSVATTLTTLPGLSRHGVVVRGRGSHIIVVLFNKRSGCAAAGRP